MEEKKEKTKKRNKVRRAKHLPWDEVSLPGAGTSPTEQQTIFEVINNRSTTQPAAEATSESEATADSAVDIAGASNTNNTTKAPSSQVESPSTARASDDLVSNHSTTNTESSSQSNESVTSQIPFTKSVPIVDIENEVSATTEVTNTASLGDTEATKATTPSIDRQCSSDQGHVLDIESHLIETYDEYQTEDDSVGINELPPQQDELIVGSSKVETAANVRTVIEVEPIGSVSKKPIEFVVQAGQVQRIEADNENTAQSEEVETKNAKKEEVTKTAHFPAAASDSRCEPSDAIKETAERLVNEIEREVLEALKKCDELKAENVANAQILDDDDGNAANKQIDKDQKTEPTTTLLDEISNSLTQKVDAQLSEVTSILKSSKPGYTAIQVSGVNSEALKVDVNQTPENELKIVNVPSPKTPSDVEERKLFLESLPQIDSNAEAQKLADDCKREYYQSLKKYLIESNADRPPVPLQTYRWEDLRRAKERGGYPWTHLYKRPLGPDEEPEILLLLRKSQEIRFVSESPKSLKKVRIDEQVIVKQPERYIQELSEAEEDYPQSAPEDEESFSLRSESISCVSDSILATGKPRKPTRLEKIRGYLRRRKGGRTNEDAQSLPCASINSSRRHSEEHLEQPSPQILVNGNHTEQKHCYPIMKKLKSMADRQKKRLNIRRIHLGKDEKIVLGEETKILKLKNSPKAERGEIPHFIEKQDSDDVLEIMELDESPSRKRRDDGKEEPENAMDDIDKNLPEAVGIVVPDEIIEISKPTEDSSNVEELATTEASAAPTEASAAPTEASTAPTTSVEMPTTTTTPAPKKAPRLRREHVYEEIGPEAQTEHLTQPTITADGGILQLAAVEALKESLAKQDSSALKQIEEGAKPPPLDRMGSSEEEQINASALTTSDKPSASLLAPLSSIDSTSSDEDRNRTQLSAVTEESDGASVEDHLRIISDHEPLDLKPAIKKEASPAPSDKKVTFSHVEDEAEPHREDIELPLEIQEATQAEAANRKKWTSMSDHEYEPIAAPSNAAEPAAVPQSDLSNLSRNIEKLHEDITDAQALQDELEERYFSSEATTPRTDSRTDYEIHTSQVDSSALEELPLQPENRKKGFMASAQDRTRKMQAGIRSQADKIKTKLRTPAKKPASSSPKAKERKRFKAPEFSKMKMPEIKRPDMSKLTDFKRPEFTKFNKPDMSKFKLPEKFSTIKLKRSKSFKENEAEDEEMPDAATAPQSQKKMFDFNFGTYPRAFRKKKKPIETQASLGTETGTEGLSVSVIPSTETQPSLESSSSPQGDRGPGPVRSRWADKFSDVSYNDSEGSRYRRYGSEQESFERESSLERRMKDDLEETESGETQEMSIMGRVADTKQFAEFDEENRAIHEISKMRAGEFRRRPMVHQDSDLRSEDSKEVEGWTDKEIEKNKLLRKAELEAEAGYLKYVVDDINQETQSAASSGKKVVMEEIDDDEFFLRKRGISEDNIELRQYISDAIREGYDRPFNALEHVGQPTDRAEYRDYDIPPPKPKRLHKGHRSQDTSQDLEFQRSEYGDDLSMSQNGSDFYAAPKRPMRKGRSRSKYSIDSQDFPVGENLRHEHYFDDDEDYLRPPRNSYKGTEKAEMNDLDIAGKQVFPAESADVKDGAPAPAPSSQPQAPRRRKRDTRESSLDKDSFMNGFGGRSVSNSRLQPTEDVIVFRTQHEYPVPLASAEKFTPTPESRKSRTTSRNEEDESLDFDSRGESQVDNASRDGKDKFVIDMMENDGYAVVRKEHLPKPTPPARRKKFSRSPGERFTTISAVRAMKAGTPPPPERPPPPSAYTPSTMEEPVVAPRRKSTSSLDMVAPQILEDDYEEPEALQQERPESPRNLQSGDIVNKMKFRPLPAPPRPPREKRQRIESRSSAQSAFASLQERDMVDEKIATSSTADSYDPTDVDLEEEERRLLEVEVSTQTDPLPDDFECEEFEITDDMRIIEPRINNLRKTLDELLKEEELKIKTSEEATPQLTEEEQLARGLQRFRDANQRSMSERSRASSQADRSKSQSRPQTPSAVVIERRVSTPIPSQQQQQSESMLEAALIVRPIDDLDLEEEELRREGLLTDSSQHSKSDVEASTSHDEEEVESRPIVSDYSRGPSSEELDAALEELRAQGDSNYEEERDESDLAEINEEELYEKRSDALLAKYRDYLSEETSQKDEETSEREEETVKDEIAAEEVSHEIQTESEEIATMSVTSEDEQRISILKEEQEQEKEEERIVQAHDKINVDDLEDYIAKVEEGRIEDTTAVEEPPLPPPRRKSTTAVDAPPTLSLAEQPTKELTPVPTLAATEVQPTPLQFPTHLGELEVERLRVHALQAGQIMVSQLHGAQISAEDLECKSGNLIVKNIALPEGFIEDIVERVRTTDRSQLLTVETQTSLQASREALAAKEDKSPVRDLVPPPKPPRQRDLDATAKRTMDTADEIALQQLRNYDEETQTDPLTYPVNMTNVPPPVFTTTEYLQSMPPPPPTSMELYNLRRGLEQQQYGGSMDGNEAMHTRRLHHHQHHHHHRRHRRCESSCSECEDSEDLEEREETRSRSHSRRSRSSTRPPTTEPQTVGKAGQQFVSACSLSIAHMINRLTAAIRGVDADKNMEAHVRHIPTIVALFVLVSFTLIVYLLSGRNVHTHHWDFFNPPGNGPRPT